MANSYHNYLSELLIEVGERGRALLDRRAPKDEKPNVDNLLELSWALLDGKGEATGLAMATEVSNGVSVLAEDEKSQYFQALGREFGPDQAALESAIAAYQADPSDQNASRLHFDSEPKRQQLFRLLNQAPNGVSVLADMRVSILERIKETPELSSIDRDLLHLFSSWFNRGFLEMKRLDWNTPAAILNKIIQYEAVHQIDDWNDLRRRVDTIDRCCYSFFHPSLTNEPLIFVEVALTDGIPDAISPILQSDREPLPLDRVNTATFYSISNCQQGLKGVSFGNFLIKQVVEDLRARMPQINTFVTLSPVPGFGRWIYNLPAKQADQLMGDLKDQVFEAFAPIDPDKELDVSSSEVEDLMKELGAYYLLHAKTGTGEPLDPVSRFHLGNGASLNRLNWRADNSDRGRRQSAGLMVNYLYELNNLERNHETYVSERAIAVTGSAKTIRKESSNELVEDSK